MYEVIIPGSKEYESARQVWNRAIDKYPCYIIYCKSYQEVREALLFARRNQYRIRIRSGGHNYAGFSTGNGVVLIDLGNLNKVQVNQQKNTVTAQGGVFLGQLYNYVSSLGYPFPGGTCPTVGLSGVISGGGWGYSTRYLGLACDSLIELVLMDYQGCILRANKKENPDLFWACKGGGGGNFGIILSMTFELPQKVEQVTYFTIRYSDVTPQIQLQFLELWQDWIQTAPNEITMKGSLVHPADGSSYILATGMIYGTMEFGNLSLAPFLAIQGAVLTYETVSFLQAVELVQATYPRSARFYNFARFVNTLYPEETLEQMVQRLNAPLPVGSKEVLLNVYGMGGAVKNISPYDTAYYYRDSNYILLVETIFDSNDNREENKAWVDTFTAYLYGITEGSYINFPSMPLPNYLCDYYGENLTRLQCVKRKYDPFNVFTFPQSIR